MLRSLTDATDRLSVAALGAALDAWLATAERIPRREALEELAALAPLVLRLTPPDGAAYICDAIEDTARWWP